MNRVGLALILSEHSHPAPRAHPERYERLRPVAEALNEGEMQERVTPLPSRSYNVGVLKRVHSADHIAGLQTFSQSGCGYLDPDTYRVASSFAASCDVTWSLLSGGVEAFAGRMKNSFVIGRPPRHHAETGRAMGFCLVNHVAVAAQYALDTYPCEKVAVVDFDVHHGNGTQQIFYERGDVLYISTHQYPFYPGTGAKDERGRGEGEGFTLNCPLPAGTGDAELLAQFEQALRRRIEEQPPPRRRSRSLRSMIPTCF